MVRILEENRQPSFSEQLAKGLGPSLSNISSGLGQVATERRKQQEKIAEKLKGEKSKVLSSLNTTFKTLDIAKELNSKQRTDLVNATNKYVDQGMDAVQASLRATQELMQKDAEEAQQKQQIEQQKKAENTWEKQAEKLGGTLGKYVQKGIQQKNFMAKLMGKHATPEQIQEQLKENPGLAGELAESFGASMIDLPLILGLAKRFGFGGAFPLFGAINRATGEILEAARTGQIKLPGVTPGEGIFRGTKEFEELGNIYKPEMAERGKKLIVGTMADTLTAGLLEKIPGLKSIISQTPVIGKYLNGYIAQQAEKTALEAGALGLTGALEQGRLPTMQDFAHGLGMVAAFQIGGKMTEATKGYIEKARSKFPAKETAKFDEAFGNLTPEEAKSVAEAKSPEEVSEVVETAMDRLKIKEVKPITEAGKAGEIAQKTEAPEVTGKGKLQPIEKERAKAIETLKIAEPESLEKYTEKERKPEEGQERKTAAGQAAEKMRVDELKKQRERVLDEFQEAKDEVERFDKAYKEAAPEAKVKIETNIRYAKKRADELHQKIKDLEYQMKWGRERPTPESLDEQIKSTFEQMEADIKDSNPKTEKDLQKLENQMKKLEEDLAHAEKLAERGELPKVDYEDTYVKVEKQYAKAYKDMLEKIADELRDISRSRSKEDIKRAKELREFRERLQSRLKHNEAKTKLQLDKIRGKHLLKGAKGAFNKQLLKQMRQDVAELQRDYFQHKKIMGAEEAKATKAAKEAITKLAEEYARNPTEENARALEEKTGIPKEQIRETKEAIGELLKKTKQAEEKPTGKTASAEKIAEQAANKAASKINKHLKRLGGSILGGQLVAGLISPLIEEMFDKKDAGKIKQGLYIVLRIFGGYGERGGYGIGKAVGDLVRDQFDESRIAQYKNASIVQKKELAKKWHDQFGPTRANRIIKSAKD